MGLDTIHNTRIHVPYTTLIIKPRLWWLKTTAACRDSATVHGLGVVRIKDSK